MCNDIWTLRRLGQQLFYNHAVSAEGPRGYLRLKNASAYRRLLETTLHQASVTSPLHVIAANHGMLLMYSLVQYSHLLLTGASWLSANRNGRTPARSFLIWARTEAKSAIAAV